jgi:cell division protein FtsQ
VSAVALGPREIARVRLPNAWRPLPELRRLLPSRRSAAIAAAVVLGAVGAYAGARFTSVFAVRTVDVRGGTPVVRAEVRAALADIVGRSLMRVDGATVAERLVGIPDVRSFTYDRAFPHTLRVTVRRELPVLVVRRVPGSDALLVAASGKVLRELPHPRLSRLPRLWVKKDVSVAVGQPLPPLLHAAATALASVRDAGLPGGVASVRVGDDDLTLILGGGLEVRLGDSADVPLKLAIARRILQATGAAAGGTGYVDVSVPNRPVVSTNSQVVGLG